MSCLNDSPAESMSGSSLPTQFTRRGMLKCGFSVGAGLMARQTKAATPQTDRVESRYRLAVKYPMIQGDSSVKEKFRMLREIGYDGVEVRSRDKMDWTAVRKASEETGLPVHGVVNSSNPDIITAINLSRDLGGTSVLVVAGRVDREHRYDQVYEETSRIIRTALPHAEKTGIRILVENVWNNFLLSPLEMARYVDQFESSAVGVYFDVGNVVRFGWPAHWIAILGNRIGKLDIKEYSRKKQRDEGLWKGFEVEIGDGDSDWRAVRQELVRTGFRGWATAEVRGGDRKRLTEIHDRMRRVLNEPED